MWVRMSSVCPECGGNLKFDPSRKRYICQSCGLSLSREEIDDLRYKQGTEDMDEKERIRKEYLKWWAAKK